MVNLGIRGKHFITSLLLTMVAVIIAGIYLEHALGNWLEHRVASELTNLARAGRGVLERFAGEPGFHELDALADVVGAAQTVRVTIIADDGLVFGDSQLSVGKVMQMDNHADRPEFIMAQKSGIGYSKRYSNTVGTNMLYVGIPFSQSDSFSGVVRAAMSLEDVDAARLYLRWVLLFAALLAGGAAISFSGLTSHFATKKLRQLVEHAQSLTPGYIDTATPAKGTKDEIEGLVGTFNQLATTLQLRVDDLSRERDRMHSVLQGLEEGVVVLDDANHIVLFNESAMTLLNLEYSAVGHTLDQSVAVTELNDFMEWSRTTGRSSAFEFSWPGPPQRQLSVWFTPIYKRQDWILVLRDVTEIRHLENVRKDFVANVSHELRTPISVIQANAETLVNSARHDQETSMMLAGAMERNAQRVSRIITDLLEIARLEADHSPMNLEAVQLLGAVTMVVDMISSSAEEKGVELTVDVAAELWVMAEPGLLNQVLFNLLENAVKYIPAGARVDVVGQSLDDKLVKVEIRDNGPGISKEHQDRIFERFYRVDTGRSRKLGGTGLGLSIVKHMVEKMGGSVGMEPVQPHGACFWFILNRQQAMENGG